MSITTSKLKVSVLWIHNCSMLYWLHAGMAHENLEEFRQVKKKKKTKYKARFEPATFCSTHKSPNHYTTAVAAAANHYSPPYHRQILETNPANHWQPIPNPLPSPYRLTLLTIGNPFPTPSPSHPTLLTIGNPSQPPAPPIHTAYTYISIHEWTIVACASLWPFQHVAQSHHGTLHQLA